MLAIGGDGMLVYIPSFVTTKYHVMEARVDSAL